jgi:hypothetical protein
MNSPVGGRAHDSCQIPAERKCAHVLPLTAWDSANSLELRIASSRRGVGVGVGAQRTQVRGRVGHADHGQRSSLVLAVERCRLGYLERAAVNVGLVGNGCC